MQLNTDTLMFINAVETYITAEHIADVALGVIDDIINKKWPDDTNVTPIFTLKDMHNLEGFYKEQWLVRDLVAMTVARSFHILVRDIGINLEEVEPTTMILLVKLTERPQEVALATIMDKALALYGDVEVDSILSSKMKASFDEMVETVTGVMDEDEGGAHSTVH